MKALVDFLRKLFNAKGGRDERASPAPSSGNATEMSGKMAASIEHEMERHAAEFIVAFTVAGSPIDGRKLDYEEPSLALVDRVLDDFYRLRAPLPDDIHGLVSAYIFEVARREFGGRYVRGDSENPLVLVIGEGSAEVGVCVMSKVHGRAANGPEDSIPYFYSGIAPLVSAGRRATLI
jgi:hypothetical protein